MKIFILLSLLSLTSATVAMEHTDSVKESYTKAATAKGERESNVYKQPLFKSEEDSKLFLDLASEVSLNFKQIAQNCLEHTSPILKVSKIASKEAIDNLRYIAAKEELNFLDVLFLEEFLCVNNQYLYCLTKNGFTKVAPDDSGPARTVSGEEVSALLSKLIKDDRRKWLKNQADKKLKMNWCIVGYGDIKTETELPRHYGSKASYLIVDNKINPNGFGVFINEQDLYSNLDVFDITNGNIFIYHLQLSSSTSPVITGPNSLFFYPKDSIVFATAADSSINMKSRKVLGSKLLVTDDLNSIIFQDEMAANFEADKEKINKKLTAYFGNIQLEAGQISLFLPVHVPGNAKETLLNIVRVLNIFSIKPQTFFDRFQTNIVNWFGVEYNTETLLDKAKSLNFKARNNAVNLAKNNPQLKTLVDFSDFTKIAIKMANNKKNIVMPGANSMIDMPVDIKGNSSAGPKGKLLSLQRIEGGFSVIPEESETQTAMSAAPFDRSIVPGDPDDDAEYNSDAESNRSDLEKEKYRQDFNKAQLCFGKNKGESNKSLPFKMSELSSNTKGNNLFRADKHKPTIDSDTLGGSLRPLEMKTLQEVAVEKQQKLLGNSRNVSKGKMKRYNSALLKAAREMAMGTRREESRDKSLTGKRCTLKRRGSHINFHTDEGLIALWDVHGNKRGVSAKHIERLATRGLNDSSAGKSLGKTATKQQFPKKDD